MEKASGSTAKISSTIVKELEIAYYQITFCHFPLCFIELKDLYTLIFLRSFSMNLRITLPLTSLVNFPFSV